MTNKIKPALTAILALAAAAPTWAYVGPGAGFSLTGAAWGLLSAVALSLGVIVAWPVRYLWRKLKASQQHQSPSSERETADETS